jgi:hypothetical protein
MMSKSTTCWNAGDLPLLRRRQSCWICDLSPPLRDSGTAPAWRYWLLNAVTMNSDAPARKYFLNIYTPLVATKDGRAASEAHGIPRKKVAEPCEAIPLPKSHRGVGVI